jgi:hypothetical protein
LHSACCFAVFLTSVPFADQVGTLVTNPVKQAAVLSDVINDSYNYGKTSVFVPGRLWTD